MSSGTKILILAVAAAVLSASTAGVLAGVGVDYEIQVFESGSASWIIRQTVTINDTYDSLSQFQNKIQLLIEAARNSTGRDMVAEAISISSVVSGAYVSVEYVLRWENFSQIENRDILVGDVFEVQGLFQRLYGDGGVQMIFPDDYSPSRSVPSPSRRDDSAHLLEWLGTAEFENGYVDIIFTRAESTGSPDSLSRNIFLIGGVTAVAVGFVAGILVLKRRKAKGSIPSETYLPSMPAEIESDEDRIVKMLKSTGGSAHQTAIAEHLRFSRSKTSQLLQAMEKNGTVQRQTKGRDKIVTLIEKDGEKKH